MGASGGDSFRLVGVGRFAEPDAPSAVFFDESAAATRPSSSSRSWVFMEVLAVAYLSVMRIISATLVGSSSRSWCFSSVPSLTPSVKY